MTELNDIKNRFIVDDKLYEQKKIAAITEVANIFIKVSRTGRVLFERIDLSNKDRIALVFIGRFLGSVLDPEINREVSNDEISEITGIDSKQVSARMTDLKKSKLIERSGSASHKVTGMFATERYLKKLKERHSN